MFLDKPITDNALEILVNEYNPGHSYSTTNLDQKI